MKKPNKVVGLLCVYEALSRLAIKEMETISFVRALSSEDFTGISNVMKYFHHMEFTSAQKEGKVNTYTFTRTK